MLRDDAIRAGLIRPTDEDRIRMRLTDEDIPQADPVFDTADTSNGIEAIIDFEDLNYLELKKKAKQMGIKLPHGYIYKETLIELIAQQLNR